MIDPNSETLISLSEAARHLPRRRAGASKRLHVNCLFRLDIAGSCDVVVESVQTGGTRYTLIEALARFIRLLIWGDVANLPDVPSVAQQNHAVIAVREPDEAGP